MTEDAFVASKSTRRAAAVAVGAHAIGSCWARHQASDAALTFVTVMLQAAWALARRRALDDGASAKATGLLLCLGAGDACAALLKDFARGPALGLIMALLAAPGVLLSSTPEAVFDSNKTHRSMAGALASLGLAAVALVVLTRLPAEGTALFESASIAAWALSARVAACWLPPDQILPRKACESLVAGAAAGALYLAHADATLLATIRLVCLAGALNSAGRAHVAGALLAAAVEAPKIFATAFLAASLALLGAAARPPRRAASRCEDRVAARPDRAVVLAAAGALAATVLTHYSAAALLRTVSSDKGGLHVTPSSRRRVDRVQHESAVKFCFCTGPSSPRRPPTRRGASARSTRRASATPSRARTAARAPVPTPPRSRATPPRPRTRLH